MATTITKALADTYFAPNNHINSTLWFAFSNIQRTGSIAEAIRVLSRALGESLTAETVVTADYYQPNYAAYEQALYSLTNSHAIPNGEESGPKFIAGEGGEATTRADMPLIGKEAKRWLGWGVGSTVSFSRG